MPVSAVSMPARVIRMAMIGVIVIRMGMTGVIMIVSVMMRGLVFVAHRMKCPLIRNARRVTEQYRKGLVKKRSAVVRCSLRLQTQITQ